LKPPKMSDDDRRKRKRESMSRRRKQNPQRQRDKAKAWRQKNIDRERRKMREYVKRRFFWSRANRLKGQGKATYKDIARLWKLQRGKCALTGERLDRTAQLDHKTPKVRGGSDTIENLQWVTKTVNLAKRDLTVEEFHELCGNVMSWIGQRIQTAEEANK